MVNGLISFVHAVAAGTWKPLMTWCWVRLRMIYVYATVKLFETGVLDREETIKRLKVETLYDQTLFHTTKSLDFCKYADVQQI